MKVTELSDAPPARSADRYDCGGFLGTVITEGISPRRTEIGTVSLYRAGALMQVE